MMRIWVPVLHVLLVGNSLTYWNDMPSMLREIAARDGVEMQVEVIAKPDYSLEDHWNEGDVARRIARGDLDFVVLQQGPSALPESRALLREYVKRFDGLIKSAHARTALYMVWPSRSRSFDADASAESYRLAAEDVGALLLPVGKTWRDEFISEDGLHPTEAGSRHAAEIIYRGLHPSQKAVRTKSR